MYKVNEESWKAEQESKRVNEGCGRWGDGKEGGGNIQTAIVDCSAGM